MMDYQENRRRSRRRARERQMARQHRREVTASGISRLSGLSLPGVPSGVQERVKLLLRDAGWYLRHNPQILKFGGFLALVVFLFFAANFLLSGHIFPNIWSMGIDLGDMTGEEATDALNSAWFNDVKIDLLVNGQVFMSVAPADLGLQLDTAQTVSAAYGAGLSGVPLGYGVAPAVTVDYRTAQSFFIGITDRIYQAPYDAGFTWENGRLVAVEGRAGRALNVALTVERLTQDAVGIVNNRRLDLLVTSLAPNMVDASDLVDAAYAFASQPFQVNGYDPFLDEHVPWTTTRDEVTNWLAAGPNGLVIRPDTFQAFVDALSQTLPDANNAGRYIDPSEATTAVQQAIADGAHEVTLRIRYRPGTYTVQSGDTAFAIARRTGVPFYMIRDANNGRNLDNLIPGDVISIPPLDNVVPKDVVPDKRIVVNLMNQTLSAFENGQEVFHWYISSGLDAYPTSPGIYQILDHEPTALGSSYSLCSDSGCGQWQMNWFMGIYEVQPGLMNGLHGGVLLPNGRYLGGGNVGQPYTFGCVMSQDAEGKALYDWAEDGTIVEIISSEFAPRSALARQVQQEPLPPPPA